MCRFSIIVPIYNVYPYLRRCLDSLVNQNYTNYEIILVNDGSTDNSQEIIDEYKAKYSNIKTIEKQNGGLSDARNSGIEIAVGEYLIFVDSDDYIDTNMLSIIDKKLNNKYDLVKFCYDEFNENNEFKTMANELNFVDSGYNVFKKLCFLKQPFEMAWLYVYNRQFFNNNNFRFAKGKIHEDFGLTPIVIVKAKKVLVCNDVLYHYYVSSNSITRHHDYSKTLKMANDYLYHFDFLYSEINKIDDCNDTKKIFLSYLSNGLIEKTKTLKNKDFDNYINELKKRKVFSLIIDDTLSRKLKKIMLKIFPKLYLRSFR